jgi:hypothetical protein
MDKARAKCPHRRQDAPSGLSRFGSVKVRPGAAALRADHPALVEGRTLFPGSVVDAADSPRVLVSGTNNPKLGRAVQKGDRKGWPIFHLTLEERATCPRSCAVWDWCYGNAMHLARRHRPGPNLIYALNRELSDLSMRHPKGFLVRLHTLGDFYSVPYVQFWGRMLASYKALHIFGYTAHSRDSEIGLAVAILSTQWDRCAIRFSGVPAPQGSVVVDGVDDILASTTTTTVVCPAQTEASMACATCGLCWAPAFQAGCVAFLRHGMRARRTPTA